MADVSAVVILCIAADMLAKTGVIGLESMIKVACAVEARALGVGAGMNATNSLVMIMASTLDSVAPVRFEKPFLSCCEALSTLLGRLLALQDCKPSYHV